MKKLKSTLPNMVIVLTAFTLLAGFLLGYVHELTAPAAAKAAADKRDAALKEVVREFNNNPTEEVEEITLEDGIPTVKVYPAKKDGELFGAAVESTTTQGFSGNFTIMVGFDIEGNILGYSVTKHSETAGLGAKMVDWFKAGNKGDITGKNPWNELNGSDDWQNALRVSKDGGQIDAITASTISSRAFLNAVNIAAEAWKVYLENNK